MKIRLTIISFLINFCFFSRLHAQLPFVYDSENTGTDCPAPPLPDPADLQNYPLLPDPFSWSDGSGRSTVFGDWECRRNEIKAEIEEYEIGPKPEKPSNITASYENGLLTVTVTENGETLTLTSEVVIPEGSDAFPVVIGMNSPTGSLPPELFEGVIQIPFNHNQVVTYSQSSNRNLDDPYYNLYPDLTYVGNYSAWSWGVSRLIDGIAIVQEELQADMEHIAVTGCSYAGKMALFAGAFDERIALTIAQESGGGGINSWRVSETIGNVEKIDNTNYAWFMERMKTNFQGRVGTLPHDHHELMAMIVPRALLVLGNPPYEWLGDESGYVASRAVQEVYKNFKIQDRFGFSFRSGHNHCALPSESDSEVQAFVDKFLFGDTSANTSIEVHPFQDVDYNRWIEAWKEPADPNTPQITIDSPEDQSSYEAPATVTFSTTVTDSNDDVTLVEFFSGDEKIGEDDTAPYTFTWENISGGTYYISAEAVDAQDLQGTSNVVSISVNTPPVHIYKTSTAPTIDGTIDNLWNNAQISSFTAQNILTGIINDTTDLGATAKMTWDDNNLYVLAQVWDDTLKNDSPNTYDDDNIEIYIDGNNAKTAAYDADDVQYSFGWDDDGAIGVLPADRSVEGIVYEEITTATGYRLEIQMPWTTLQVEPQDQTRIGFDFMSNDDDNGGGRNAKLSWNATSDQAYQDASLFGTIILDNTFLSISEEFSPGGITLYPNPVDDYITVSGLTEAFRFTIIDSAGKIINSGTSNEKIKLKSLPRGIYFIKIINKNNRETIKKIMKR